MFRRVGIHRNVQCPRPQSRRDRIEQQILCPNARMMQFDLVTGCDQQLLVGMTTGDPRGST